MIIQATDKQRAEADEIIKSLYVDVEISNYGLSVDTEIEDDDGRVLSMVVERDYLVDQLLQAARRERELRYTMECMEIIIGKEL